MGCDVVLVAVVLLGVGALFFASLISRIRRLEARLALLERDGRAGVPVAQEPTSVEPPGAPVLPESPRLAPPPIAKPSPVVPPAEPAPAPIEPVALPPAAASESLETRIGARGLLYVGIAAVVIGVAYFEKLAIDYGWIGETARVLEGAIAGLALVYGGTWFVRRGQAAYGQIVSGGGGAVLYLSTYAAFTLYGLIARPVAFALMVAITALIGWLGDRYRSQGLALFAVGGGFATPFLLPGNTDAHVALFTYDAILIAGTAVMSRRRDWPYLHVLSLIGAALTVGAWADRFYTPSKYLVTEAYLTLYTAMFAYIQRGCRHERSEAARAAAMFLWLAPAGYYLASITILFDHSTALLVWVVALATVGGILAIRVRTAAGLTLWLLAMFPLLLWCAVHNRQAVWTQGLITASAIYVIALVTQLRGTSLRADGPLSHADVAWLHFNPLLAYAAAFVLIMPTSMDGAGYVAAALGAVQWAIAASLWHRRHEQALHFVAVGCALAAIAIGLLFDGAAVTAGWAVEGAAVILLGDRTGRGWLRVAGAGLFTIAILQTLARLAGPSLANHQLVFNARTACAALVAGLCYALAWTDRRGPRAADRTRAIAAALVTAQIVTLAAITAEIGAYWAVRNGRLESQLTMSIAWAAYATAVVLIGLWRRYAPIRYFAIVVLAVTIAKVFFIDMAELDRIYRVGSLAGLGVLLLVTSYLYSRWSQSPG